MLSVVVDDTRDPAWNLALDEALARAGVPSPMTLGPGWAGPGPAGDAEGVAPRDVVRSAVEAPVLRVWENGPGIVVGRFQNLGRAVDLAACARDGVSVVRRATGGGALYTEPGCLLFTLVRRLPSADGPAARPGARPDLDALVATAVKRLGLPARALRGGAVRTARLRTRRAVLTHAAVRVTEECVLGDRYLAEDEHPGTEAAGGGSLAGHGVEVTPDAVRSAVLAAAVESYGDACPRRPNAIEQACRDHLYAVRYGDFSWHLTGAPVRRGICWEQICR
ncbi:lipoate--protein ligase family protein [Actinomadura miaoliensis]|uniref:BPL/LPL catalytic domain-containing protein n=1 Tax=Actinomadura miaoliensis TaxID=430685 RepID=A0ABP7W6K2_9ACTN